VDHGTALDRAGTGHLERGSLDAAIALALNMSAQTVNLVTRSTSF